MLGSGLCFVRLNRERDSDEGWLLYSTRIGRVMWKEVRVGIWGGI